MSTSIKPDISAFLLKIVSNLPLVPCFSPAFITNTVKKSVKFQYVDMCILLLVICKLVTCSTVWKAPLSRGLRKDGYVKIFRCSLVTGITIFIFIYILYLYTAHFVAHQVLLVFLHLACGPRKFFIVKTDLEMSGGWTPLIEVKPWGPRFSLPWFCVLWK